MPSEIYIPEPFRRRYGGRNATLGSETLIYFRRLSDQHLVIPPVSWAKTPRGYVKMEANSAKELEKISKEFEAQKQREFAGIDEKQCQRIEAKHAEIRGRLHTRMNSAACSQLERDFIKAALKRLEAGEANLRPRRIEGHLACEDTEAER